MGTRATFGSTRRMSTGTALTAAALTATLGLAAASWVVAVSQMSVPEKCERLEFS